MLSTVFVSLLFVTHATSDFVKPWFCHGLDCPEFTVTKNTSDYQLRHYVPSKWVATNMTVASGTYGRHNNGELFQRLFKYISGNNSPSEKVEMTAPVVTTVFPEYSTGQSMFVMHFMIPHDKRTNTPVPSDSNVYLVDLPALDIYVKSFGGFAGETTFENNLKELKSTLSRNRAAHDSSHFFTAGYDSPFTFVHRHNEVWVEALTS